MKSRPTVKSLLCELTTDEYVQRSERLVAVMEEIRQKKLEAKAAARAAAEEIQTLDRTRVELGRILHERSELRDVPCRIEQVRSLGIERIIRLDTAELVSERKLTPEELQEEMGLEGVAQA